MLDSQMRGWTEEFLLMFFSLLFLINRFCRHAFYNVHYLAWTTVTVFKCTLDCWWSEINGNFSKTSSNLFIYFQKNSINCHKKLSFKHQTNLFNSNLWINIVSAICHHSNPLKSVQLSIKQQKTTQNNW